MRVEFIQEPNLEFGSGFHIDTRFGLMNLGPLDVAQPAAPHCIRIGLCGSPNTIEGVVNWIDRCRKEIPAKQSPRFNLFPKFPGFNPDIAFRSEIIIESRNQRVIHPRVLVPLLTSQITNDKLNSIVEVFFEELKLLVENSNIDVLVCAPPPELDRYSNASRQQGEEETGGNRSENDNIPTFHDLLKARSMELRKPLQLIFPATYGLHLPKIKKRSRPLQDEATRAWNFHVALYYKAGGRPWRLVRNASDLTTCFIGVSFFKSSDKSRLLTSMAQVFNERGHGVIVRGSSPKISKDDRQPHLSKKDAFALMAAALKNYKYEHRTLPARAVVHKTSKYNKAETEGFLDAIKDNGIDSVDLVSLRKSSTKLFRRGAYPPLRGSILITESGPHFLYSRGSVGFYSAYPGLYVPRPIEFMIEQSDSTPMYIGKEILELTKMNWNSTQFDNSEPITLRAARQVGAILRYIDENSIIDPRYSYYM